MEKLLLRPSEAAESLGLSKSKIYELISKEVIPSVRIGKSVRVPSGALRAWLEGKMKSEQGQATVDTFTV